MPAVHNGHTRHAPEEDGARLTAIFTKHPTPGRVKTRLCPPLSDTQAARLSEAMLRDTVARCLGGRFRSVLVFDPPEEARWFAATFPELRDQRPQCGADLGARLAHFVAGVFRAGGARSLVVVGSDQPLVPRARLDEAHRLLASGVECVLGPDPGGGYYLIGLARSVPELFTAVPMSSAGTCAATETLALALGLRVARLAEHPDLDVEADLRHLHAALGPGPSAPDAPDYPHHTRRALAELTLTDP